MELVIIALVACGASALTFFSGFGLGTLLTPAFVLFVPVDIAVALTAIVHFANNLFKLALIGRSAVGRIVLHFGGPAIVAAFVGAWLLHALAVRPSFAAYELAGRTFHVSALKLLIAALMVVFAAWEVVPTLKNLALGPRWLPLGGALSGFLGGLSGHQGALRSAFLLRCGLEKEAFIGTGVAIALLIDATRLATYAAAWRAVDWPAVWPALVTGVLAAFVGAAVGRRLLHKVTMVAVQRVVAALLVGIALALGAGWI